MTRGVNLRLGQGEGGREDRTQKTEYRMSNGEVRSFDKLRMTCVRLPRPCGPRNDEFSGAKNRTLQDYGLSQGGGAYGLDGEDCQEGKNQAQQSE